MKKSKKGPAPGTLYKNVKRTEMGTNIAALRRKKGLSQQALGELAGISKRMISYYERETVTIPANQLKKIANALNVAIDEIVNHQPEKTILEANRAFLKRLEIAKTLSVKDQKIISDLIDSLAEKASKD